eukprot:10124189-Ditylum_brightwellii.AAC.1
MATCTTGAIAFQPTGNSQGGYFFLSLTTGKQLNRKKWTCLPMPAEVIDHVHKLVRQKNPGLAFYDRNGNVYNPEEEDEDDTNNPDYIPPNDEAEDDDHNDEEDQDKTAGNQATTVDNFHAEGNDIPAAGVDPSLDVILVHPPAPPTVPDPEPPGKVPKSNMPIDTT